jgi:hypothetical protein
MAGKYSVMVLRGHSEKPKGGDLIKCFGALDLDHAFKQFEYHAEMIRWSKAHREYLGIHPGEDVTIQVFDHREGYELSEIQV